MGSIKERNDVKGKIVKEENRKRYCRSAAIKIARTVSIYDGVSAGERSDGE